jgi:quercetin dioxygenase-like cupin family protein
MDISPGDPTTTSPPVPSTGSDPADDVLRAEVLTSAEALRDRIASQELNVQEALRLRDLLTNRMQAPSPNPHRSGYLDEDGTLRIVDWAGREGDALHVETGARSRVMQGHLATGDGLVGNGHLGADIIRCAAGGGFAPHTHIGDHLLFVVGGEGTITYDGRVYATHAGQVYFVEGAVPHAVGAITDHVLLSIGTPHRAVDATDRQTPQEYESILANFATLECGICGVEAHAPKRLADLGCPHCPSRFM